MGPWLLEPSGDLALQRPPPTPAQVFELQPGMHSQAFWHEISLLARCQHPRIVPVYGVAIQACDRAAAEQGFGLHMVAVISCAASMATPQSGLQAATKRRGHPHPPTCGLINRHWPCVQDRLLMVAVQLMLGGSLRNALLDPVRQQELRWEAR